MALVTDKELYQLLKKEGYLDKPKKRPKDGYEWVQYANGVWGQQKRDYVPLEERIAVLEKEVTNLSQKMNFEA